MLMKTIEPHSYVTCIIKIRNTAKATDIPIRFKAVGNLKRHNALEKLCSKVFIP